jgi:hypothetical protein
MQANCYIDGSHMSNTDFQIAVIQFATEHGFEIDSEQMHRDIEWMNGEEDDESTLLDILESLDFTFDEAVDYLNSNTRQGQSWEIREASLFLEDNND